MARMLFIIVAIFIMLHIPFTVLIFMRNQLLKIHQMNSLTNEFYLLNCLSQYCLFLNAAVNPIIYGLTNDNFRRAYYQTPILPKLKQCMGKKVNLCCQQNAILISNFQFYHKQFIMKFFRFLFIAGCLRCAEDCGKNSEYKNATSHISSNTGNWAQSNNE